MRKVLSFVLVLSLVLGSFGFAFAAPLSDVVGQDCEEAVNVLTELGVVQGYPDGTFKPAQVVTRAEMAVIVVSALGLEDYAVGTANFSDMAGHWSNGYVAYAASLGIIAGYPDGTFKPNQIVSYDEAAKMLVAALGYTPDSLVGTWPANYVVKAKSLGILDGVTAGSAGAVRGDIAVMSYQTLDQKIGSTNKDGDFVLPADVDTMLTRLGAKLYQPTGGTAGDAFVMTDAIADAAATNVKDFLGAYVTAYANSDNEVIAVKEVNSVFLDGEMSDDNTEFVTDDASYKVATLATTFSAVQIVNGVVSNSAFSVSKASIPTGVIAADVDGNYLDAVYSVMDWNISDHGMITEDDLEELADAALLDGTFATDSSDEIDLTSFDLVGADSLGDIEEDDVVYVYVGGDYITKVEVGTAVVSGEITRIASDGDITVNGSVYELATSAASTVNDIFAVENEVTLSLDVNGDIYASELVSGEADLVGIVLDSSAGSEVFGSESDALLKMFLADGTEETFVVDTDEVTTTLSALEGTIVEYGLNSDGQIDTVVAFNNGTLTQATTNSVSSKGYVDGIKIAADATIFTGADVSGAAFLVADADDGFSVSTYANILDASYTDMIYYVLDGSVVLMVIEGAGSTSDAVYAVLNDTFETATWDNGVEVIIDGVTKEYNASTTAPTNSGILYSVTFNTDGEAVMAATTVLDSGTDLTVEYDRVTGTGLITGGYALADDILVYVYDEGWTVGDVDDLEDTDATVTFYATDDDAPGVATIAIVVNGVN